MMNDIQKYKGVIFTTRYGRNYKKMQLQTVWRF